MSVFFFTFSYNGKVDCIYLHYKKEKGLCFCLAGDLKCFKYYSLYCTGDARCGIRFHVTVTARACEQSYMQNEETRS